MNESGRILRGVGGMSDDLYLTLEDIQEGDIVIGDGDSSKASQENSQENSDDDEILDDDDDESAENDSDEGIRRLSYG